MSSRSRDRLDKILARVNTRGFVLAWSVLTATYIFGFATKWTFNPFATATYYPGRYFTAQADALLHGRLWVQPSDNPWECFFRSGHCYGYYGVVPSIFRLPLVVIFGSSVSNFSTLFISVASGCCTWAALDLCRRVLWTRFPEHDRSASVYMVVASVTLGPGSTLILLTDPYVYQEAIIWSAAGAILGCNLLWRWTREQQRWQIVGAITSFTLAAGSRLTSVAVGVVFVVVATVVFRHKLRPHRQLVVQMVLLALLPVLLTFGVFYLKFRSPLPSFESYQNRHNEFIPGIYQKNGGHLNGIRFTPTNMWAMLRPDTLIMSPDWPWVRFRYGLWPERFHDISYLPPLTVGSMYVEKSVSLTNVMPLSLFATLCVFARFLRRRRWSAEIVLLLALSSMPLLGSVNFAASTRFLGDWYPFVAAGTAFSAAILPAYVRFNRQSHGYFLMGIAIMTAASLVIAPMLASQFNWSYLYGFR